MSPLRLHLGCGPDIRPGWVNIDLRDVDHPDFLHADLTQPLPEHIQDVELVYSSHFLEHLTKTECSAIVQTVKSRMRSGGVFRCSLPCFRLTAQAYLDGNHEWWGPLGWPGWGWSLMDCVNFSLYQDGEHKCMWDGPSMVSFLESHGFVNVVQTVFDPGVDPHCPMRQKYSFYVQGSQP